MLKITDYVDYTIWFKMNKNYTQNYNFKLVPKEFKTIQ